MAAPVNWENVVPLLGRVNDADLAKALGVTRARVHQIRAKRGIARYGENRHRERVAPWLGKVPDAAIAALADISINVVRAWRLEAGNVTVRERLDAVRDTLGTVPDHKIARQVGCAVQTVIKYRQMRGIPAYGLSGRGRGQIAIAAVHHLVGRVPDSEIAKMTGVAVATVGAYRRKHGIAPCDRTILVAAAMSAAGEGPA